MNVKPPEPADRRLASKLTRYRFLFAGASVLMLWLAQPPLSFWPFTWICLVPVLGLISEKPAFTRRDYAAIWLASSLYWLVSLQGIRHAHPAMYVCLAALAGYLGIYLPLFVLLCRRCMRWNIPLFVPAAALWVGLECARNYMLTGISAVMLGHSLADVSAMIQIADLFGTYGVSFVIVTVNVAVFAVLTQIVARKRRPDPAYRPTHHIEALRWSITACVVAAVCVGASFFYGQARLNEPITETMAAFALVQRNEQVEYQQDVERELHIFQNYATQSIEEIERSEVPIDVVVWPESMFTGGLPWMIADPDAVAPEQYEGPPESFVSMVQQNQRYYLGRADELIRTLAYPNPGQRKPHLVVGCGVVRYGMLPHAYSGMVHVSPEAKVAGWYGKNHLVMFGEYVPLLPRIPGLRELIPAGLGVTPGEGATVFEVNDTAIVPSVCIETAVERVMVNHLSELHSNQTRADVIVTVTNDGWFDDSSILDHHRRCAQLVAVGTRRPVLSSANNGPTVWIDSCGRLVESLPVGTDGAIIATPLRDSRTSFYVRIGDLPAKLLAVACLVVLTSIAAEANSKRRSRRGEADDVVAAE
ncbi:apolipoprotein N-acyltransferase [Novipirellula sp. SH528]|uniref:apolipoprotein N-acyltransferase n=1 Tax=Novipirellula sp. SH528 TaxID=3454466 RepID=UPI003FA0EEB4